MSGKNLLNSTQSLLCKPGEGCNEQWVIGYSSQWVMCFRVPEVKDVFAIGKNAYGMKNPALDRLCAEGKGSGKRKPDPGRKLGLGDRFSHHIPSLS